MAIEIQSQSCQPSQTIQFTFQQAVQNWVVGLGSFKLTYDPGANHWVQTLSISLQTNLPMLASVGSNVLEVTVQAQLMDHSGHTVNITNSLITVVCVAVTGSSDPETLLANIAGVTPQEAQPASLPGIQPVGFSALTTCLSGLDLSYDTTDHRFQGATAGSGINTQANGTGLVNATANIWDGSGNQAVTASIDAGVLASINDTPPFMLQLVRAQEGLNVPPLSFPSAVGAVGALIQGFNVQYASDDHVVANIVVGCTSATASGPTVNLTCSASTTNGEGTFQTDHLSYVNVLVVAVPAASAAARS